MLRQSSLGSGFEILQIPSDMAAKSRARIVCDFDPGTETSPASSECSAEIFMLIK